MAGLVPARPTRARPWQTPPAKGWALAYALAWLSVSGGNSVMPPWGTPPVPRGGQTRSQAAGTTPATIPVVSGAGSWHDARKELKRWFGFRRLSRAEPKDEDGRPMQQSIVEAAMAGKHVLGILPTWHRQVALLPDPGPVPLPQGPVPSPWLSHPWSRSWRTRSPDWKPRGIGSLRRHQTACCPCLSGLMRWTGFG